MTSTMIPVRRMRRSSNRDTGMRADRSTGPSHHHLVGTLTLRAKRLDMTADWGGMP